MDGKTGSPKLTEKVERTIDERETMTNATQGREDLG
jgi:hypothetical protein